jgi:methylenetetrahydrofolate--tRNA-(uracil-5-)-methyltransferase
MDDCHVRVIGGGLAGCEAALRLADAGLRVEFHEMKPERRTPAQTADHLAELVCSNSFRSDNPENAIGLLHEELRRTGSPVLRAADAARVPAGDALAVDRVAFGRALTAQVDAHPNIARVHDEVARLPEGPTPAIVATGPLTADALAAEIDLACGGRLAFYDAIAPIVEAESVDRAIAYAASRYGKGGGDDYLNLPMTAEEYARFIDELRRGEKVRGHAFEEPRYFEGCLPIEVMAERGDETLRFGPMKPVGLPPDPRSGRPPHAVVQLRMEDRAGTSYNMVGFQTRLTWPEQRRIFRACIPGLQGAEFLRLGQVHRNTFVESPRLVQDDLSLRERPWLWLAGQLSGTEGYVEAAGSGFLCALAVRARIFGAGGGRAFVPPPPTTALGAIYGHVTGRAHPPGYEFQPTNVTWGLIPPLEKRVRKDLRRAALVARARADFAGWMAALGPGNATTRAAEVAVAAV